MTDEHDGTRPQDAGRRHARKGAPSPASAALLERYQDAMRAELGDVLGEIRGTESPAGLLDGPVTVRPPLKDRAALWDLAIKLGRELGASIDPTPVTTAVPLRGGRRRKVEW